MSKLDFLRWGLLSLKVENVPIKNREMSTPGTLDSKRRDLENPEKWQ